MMYNTRYLPENFEQRNLGKQFYGIFHIIWMCIPDGLPSFKTAEKAMTALIVSQDRSCFGLNLSPIFQRLPATAMFNNDFLTADVI